MKALTMITAIALMAMAALWLAGCGEQMGVEPIDEPTNLNGDPPENSPQIDSYPPYCFSLSVPFLPQVPPGTWSATKNCGQACAVMLGGYFNYSAVNSSAITVQNTWLANYTGNQSYNQPNGWYTSSSQLTALLWQKHGLHSSVYTGTSPDQVVNQVANGKPCIVSVMINNGVLVSSGGISHWALVVGWNGNIILNDPGTNSGNHKSYSIAAFNASWATQGKTYIPVWK